MPVNSVSVSGVDLMMVPTEQKESPKIDAKAVRHEGMRPNLA